MRTKLALLVLVALTGCASDEPEAETIVPPPSLLVGCRQTQELPRRELTGAEVEVYWGRDRDALRDCRERHGALVGLLE